MGEGMSYWGATDEFVARGGAPICPVCGKTMFAEDDHGRFQCSCGYRRNVHAESIMSGETPGMVLMVPTSAPRQVDTTGMTDEQKARIPPINRLESMPTAAEAELFALMARGPDVMGTPEYAAACAAVDRERGIKSKV